MKFLVTTFFLVIAASALANPLSMPPEGSDHNVTPGSITVRPIQELSAFSSQDRARLTSRFSRQKSVGWIDATAEESQIFDRYFVAKNPLVRNSNNLAELLPNLNMEPADLSQTPLQNATLINAIPAGGFVDGGWTGLVRVFSDSVLGELVVVEYDYLRAGSQVSVPEEAVDHYINGFPVSNFVWRGPDQSFTESRWFTETKDFTLMVRGEVPGKKRRNPSEEVNSRAALLDQIRSTLR